MSYINEEIKEILDMFTKYKDDWYSCEYKLKPKQCVILYDYITNLKQENTRLNNIIDELEKELEQEIAIVGANRTVDNNNPEWWYKLNCYGNILDKLNELKGDNK